MVAARAVDSAWSWLTPAPFSSFRRRSSEPAEARHHTGKRKSWKNPVRRE